MNYYDWQAVRSMLGLQQWPYQAPPMIYMDDLNRPRNQQQQGNSQQNYLNQLLSNPKTVSTGMTPNAVNASGEPYYGWGAQTGDWGANAAVPFDASQYGTSSAPTLSGSGETAGGIGWAPAAYVAAAIAGQHLMSGDTDRRTNYRGELSSNSGHRTGDVFSGDFFTEPWMAWGEEKLGINTPTPGERTDAAIDRLREGKGGFSDVAGTVPSTAYQWFDPVGSFLGDFVSDKFGGSPWGKAASYLVWPQTGVRKALDWIGDLF